jgi:predicted DNA-binding transcriptional regulator AlpA
MATIEADISADSEPLLVTAKVVARLLNVSTRSLWRMKSAGNIPSPVRVGSAVRWRIDEIKAWIAAGCPKQAPDHHGGRGRR